MSDTLPYAQLSTLYVYPIKSLAGIPLTQAMPEGIGLKYDRRWMLTTPDGHFLSQRTIPPMALLQPTLQESGLVVWDRLHPENRIHIDWEPPKSQSDIQVTIWDDQVTARPYPAVVNEWFTDVLKVPVQLVWMPPATHRPLDPDYASANESVSFADGFPYLIASQSSLDDLNIRLKTPVTMERFRPNLVVSGNLPAWDEDTWHTLRIGTWTFRSPKDCGRCEVVTIDPSTAERNAEPLRVLSGFRQKGKSILFGVNAYLQPNASTLHNPLRVGDTVALEKKV